jgi:transcriptional regulator with XRE-family HTH domain
VHDEIERRLVGRLCALRDERGLSLEAVSERTGVSRATLSRLERGESSPTAGTLGRLCAAYGCTISHLMAEVEGETQRVVRRADQTAWRDPESGFLRRIVSPPGPGLRGEVIEGRLPPGAAVDYQDPPPDGIERHILVLGGTLELTLEGSAHRLEAGDCIRFSGQGASRFRALGRTPARYMLVAIRR